MKKLIYLSFLFFGLTPILMAQTTVRLGSENLGMGFTQGCEAGCVSAGICSPFGTSNHSRVDVTETISIPAGEFLDISVVENICSSSGSNFDGSDDVTIDGVEFDGSSDIDFSACYENNTGAAYDFVVSISVNRRDETVDVTYSLSAAAPGGGGCSLLPVEFSKFEGKKDGKKVAIQWQTASEINNDRFEIERSSDARKFETIGSVKGEGNSLKLNDYSFMDDAPLNGINYYRLKQVDIDGKSAYSRMLSVKMSNQNVRITPTSTFDYVTVSTGDQSSIILRSVNGQVMNRQSDSEGNFTVDMANYPQGIYFMTIETNGIVQTEKVVRL